jgi:hypothetical protein
MIVDYPERVLWTFLVFQEERPRRGEYVDPRGYHWHVREVYPEPGVVLREPSPPAWYIEIAPPHPAYRLEPGEELRPFFTPSEIATRRGQLTTMISWISGFDYVGVSEDGFTLVVNFVGYSGPIPVVGVPSEIDWMPIECRFTS